MAVPWVVVGNLVLGNLDKIIAVVKPALTRKKIDKVDTQTDLLNQQIAELQAAAAANAEQVRALAEQLKDVVSGLEQAAIDAAAERRYTRRISWAALTLATLSLALGIYAVVV